MRSAYEVLGVSRGVGEAELRQAYRALARRLHPDVGGDSEAFLELRAAYRILSDPELRAAHDRDPTGTLASSVGEERRAAQLQRRRARLRKLYD